MKIIDLKIMIWINLQKKENEIERNYLDLHKRIRYMRGHTKKKRGERERGKDGWWINSEKQYIRNLHGV